MSVCLLQSTLQNLERLNKCFAVTLYFLDSLILSFSALSDMVSAYLPAA